LLDGWLVFIIISKREGKRKRKTEKDAKNPINSTDPSQYSKLYVLPQREKNSNIAVETTANIGKECRCYGTEKTKMQVGVREDLNGKTRNERSERREKKKKAAVDRRAKCRARSISRAGPA
jgi:hypothetical protein